MDFYCFLIDTLIEGIRDMLEPNSLPMYDCMYVYSSHACNQNVNKMCKENNFRNFLFNDNKSTNVKVFYF